MIVNLAQFGSAALGSCSVFDGTALWRFLLICTPLLCTPFHFLGPHAPVCHFDYNLWAFWFCSVRVIGQPGNRNRALGHIQPKNFGEVFTSAKDLGCHRSFACQGLDIAGPGDQFFLINLVEPEEEFRLLVKPCANTIKHRRNMLAHCGPIGATARKLDVIW